MKFGKYFVLICIVFLFIASTPVNSDVGCQGSDLPSKKSISADDLHRTDYWNDWSLEYKQAQVYFDSTKTDLFNRKQVSLGNPDFFISDSPTSKAATIEAQGPPRYQIPTKPKLDLLF